MNRESTNNKKEPVPSRGIASKERLYSIEFFRIYFILVIFIGHVLSLFPDYDLSIFGLRLNGFTFGIHFFFIVGGFFLYRRVISGTPAFELIKKTWLRLVPGMLFAFSFFVFLNKSRIEQLPSVLFLTGGTGISTPPMGFADWFFGAYFWMSCFFIGLFQLPRKYAFLILGVVSYFIASFLVHAVTVNPKNGFFMDTYYSVIGYHFGRGLLCMGVGMVAAFLSENIQLPKRFPGRIIGTAAEILCLIAVFRFSVYTNHSRMTQPEIIMTLALLILFCSQSWGYISAGLNSIRWVQLFSRYVFSCLIGHIIMHRWLAMHGYFDLSLGWRICACIVCSVCVGVLEYHLIERWLVPMLARYFFPKKVPSLLNN